MATGRGGAKVLLVDADEAVTSSKIAAGLITPITGQRIAPSWRYDDFMAVAEPFYARIEERTGGRFFHRRRSVRLLRDDRERAQWAHVWRSRRSRSHLAAEPSDPLVEAAIADVSGGGFEMVAAQLDVAGYLAASRRDTAV